MADKKLQQLIIFEGPDCAGKSTLMGQVRQQPGMGAIGVHHGPYSKVTADQLPRFYMEHMFGLFGGEHQLHMDRSWLSEPIYGDVFRGKNRLDLIDRRHLERIALRHGAVVVLCLPPWPVVESAWLARKGADSSAEYLDKIEQLRQIYDRYTALPKETDLPVVRYDYTKHKDQVKQLVRKIHEASTGVHPFDTYQRTCGSLDAIVVIVGDRPSEPSSQDTIWQFPFSSFGHSGSSAWLTAHLEHHHISERDLFWVNSRRADGGTENMFFIKEMWHRPVICLGEEAAKRFRDDVGREPDHVVAHPQYQKRFKASDPYPLGDIIKHYL